MTRIHVVTIRRGGVGRRAANVRPVHGLSAMSAMSMSDAMMFVWVPVRMRNGGHRVRDAPYRREHGSSG